MLLSRGSLPELPHLVLLRAFHRGQLTIELVRNDKVEISRVLFVRHTLERAFDLLSFPGCKDIIQVKDGLLPVRRGHLGSCRKADVRVRRAEVCIEVDHEGVQVIVARLCREQGADLRVANRVSE